MQIQAMQTASFNGKEVGNKDKNDAKNKNNGILNGSYEYYSKQCLYEANKLSIGREEEDGRYKASVLLNGLAAVTASLAAFSKTVKSLSLNKKLTKAIKNSASAERIAELKTAALKKQKGSAIALGIGLAFGFASIRAWVKNKFEADKTAKERGFMPDKELNQKAVQNKSTINKALKDIKTEETVKESKIEDTEKPV